MQVAELACIFKFAILVPANGHAIAILLIIAASAPFLLKTIVPRSFLFRLKPEIQGEEDYNELWSNKINGIKPSIPNVM